MRKLLVALVAALALPAGAQGAPMTYLSLDPSRVAPGWTLKGSTLRSTAVSFPATNVTFGLTLARSLGSGLGEESHALYAHGWRTTLAFDGRTGRWRTRGQAGTVAVVDMRIAAVGQAVPVSQLFGCHAAYRRVRVRLTGTLVLRTGTAFFKTIRRTRLTGSVTYAGHDVTCESRPPAPCETSRALAASTLTAAFNASPRELVVQFWEKVREAPGDVRWYHVMHAKGYDALTGELPSLAVAAPPSGAIRGGVGFTAGEAREAGGGCPARVFTGSVTGSLQATFAGWGTRTLLLATAAPPVYRTAG